MLTEFTTWLVHLVERFLGAAWDFITDLFISLLGSVVDAFTSLLATIPIPSWLSGGLGTWFGSLDPGILYVVSACGMPAALAIVGAGYAFRMARKIFTLFQW